ncbi:MAG: fumarylacetoacetate hydrolase family protein [Trueperella sp.]|nr:fumarylacetoacetate hydrolase family protein [Trueperella sp.]
MKIARLSLKHGPRFAAIDDRTGNYHVLAGDPIYSGVEVSGEIVAAADVNLVSPMIPRSKVVGLVDPNADLTASPDIFLKPNTSVVGPDVPIVLPAAAEQVEIFPQLAVVISRLCKEVPLAQVDDVIFGYTVVADARAALPTAPAAARAFDTSCPLGPVIATELPEEVTVTASRNGVTAVEFSVALAQVKETVAYISSLFTLLPGDVILAGAPQAATASSGDEIRCEITEIGVLRSPIVAS